MKRPGRNRAFFYSFENLVALVWRPSGGIRHHAFHRKPWRSIHPGGTFRPGERIYVPQYDPQVVYTRPYAPAYGSLLSFGAGLAVGSWLNYDFDWGNQRVYRGDWNGWDDNNSSSNWNNNRNRGSNNSNVNVINISNENVNEWQPSVNSRNQLAKRQRNNRGNARIARAEARADGNAKNSRKSRKNAAYDPANDSSLVPQPSRFALSGDRENTGKAANRKNKPSKGERQDSKRNAKAADSTEPSLRGPAGKRLVRSI